MGPAIARSYTRDWQTVRGCAIGQAPARSRRTELSKGPGVRTGNRIDKGLGMDKGPIVGTDASLRLAKGLLNKPDEESAHYAGMDQQPRVGTRNVPVLAEGLGV